MSKGPRCSFCNVVLEAGERRSQTCAMCREKGRVWSDDTSPPPSVSRPVSRLDELEEDDFDPELGGPALSFRPTPFLIFALVILVAWPLAAWWATTEPSVVFGLIAAGGALLLVGIGWVFVAAAEDGIDMRTFGGGNAAIGLFLALVQLAAVPVFSVVYLFINFEEARRGMFLEFVGIGLIVTGALMWK